MKPLRVPVLLFVLPAAVLALARDPVGQFGLARDAVGRGEFWRLWSAHWVHFSPSHLGWNLVVLLAAGTWLEHLRPGWLWRHTAVAAPLVSLALLVLEPAMGNYGGLSALATSVVTLLVLEQLRSSPTDRPLWAGLLVLVGLKLIHDAGGNSAWFARFDGAGVRVSTWAHAAGTAAALALWPRWRRLETRRLKIEPPGPVTGSRRQDSGVTPNVRRDTQTHTNLH